MSRCLATFDTGRTGDPIISPKFRKDYSSQCSTAEVISLALHSTMVSVDSKDTYIGLLFTDYSSAFHTINPTKLISILSGLGLGPSLCDWILDSRTKSPQSVRIDNRNSSTIILNTGVPKGYAPATYYTPYKPTDVWLNSAASQFSSLIRT